MKKKATIRKPGSSIARSASFPIVEQLTDKAVSNYRSQTIIKRSKFRCSLNPSRGTFPLPACSNTFSGVNFDIQPLLLNFRCSSALLGLELFAIA